MIPLPLLAFLAPIKSFVVKAAAVTAKIAHTVPGWIWACALVFVWLTSWSQRSALADLREVHADLIVRVEAQNSRAAAELQAAHARVNALQDSLTKSAKLKDAHDAKAVSQINNLSGQLRSARTDGRLRDPNASGQSSASACPNLASGSASGDADRAQAGGLLSEPLTELLIELTESADTINAAYARCRTDARELRQAYNAWRKALPVSE